MSAKAPWHGSHPTVPALAPSSGGAFPFPEDCMKDTLVARDTWLRARGMSRHTLAAYGRDVAAFLAFVENRLRRPPELPDLLAI
jgi:hypothetical protein